MIARVVDGSDFDEFKPLYGIVAGHRLGASCTAIRSGILANARGVLFSEESQKATQFIQLANRSDTPLLFLHNTTGYMVGQRVRAGRHHQARRDDDQRGVELPRPAHLDPRIGASYGAGHYGMCGRAFDPRFLFAWPSAKSAVMGGAQLAGVISIVGARRRPRREGRPSTRRRTPAMRAMVENQIEAESAADVPVRPALRRRRDRPARHPHRARPVPVGHCHTAPIEGAGDFGVFRM